MAYVSKKDKEVIVKNCKKVLDAYETKGTFRIENYSTIVLTIKKSKLNLLPERYQERGYSSNFHISQLASYFGKNSEEFKFLSEIEVAMKSAGWYNNTDSMIDYFDTAYYYRLDIGNYKTPFENV
jgi:hypothetical protein